MRSASKNVGIAAVAFLVALCVAEVAIRLFVPLRNVGPPVSAWDPVYGVRLKRNFDGVQINPEFRMHITTNSLGFRGNEPVLPLRGPLLYLGDSFTVGYGVSNGEEYPALVADTLAANGYAPIPWINDGRGNTGQGPWVKFLRTEAGDYDPRAIILQVMDNDFADNVRESLYRLGDDGSLVELPVARPGLGRIAEAAFDRLPFLANSYTLALVRQAYHTLATLRFGPPAEPSTEARAEENRLLFRLLDEVGRLCRDNGWPTVAIRVAIEDSRDVQVDSVLQTWGIRSEKIPGRWEMPGLYYEIDGHWNTAGHEYAAGVVARLLASTDSILQRSPVQEQ